MRRNHGKWQHLILLGVVNVAGCGSLWSPFLGERGGCQTDPATCSTSNDTIGADGGTVFDMMEPEVRPMLVKVTKGSFTMGSPATESGRGADEVQHAVTLTTDLWMAESEVTQRQYRNLMGSNPSSFKGDDLPVENVSWFDSVAYCNALSVKEKIPCLSG